MQFKSIVLSLTMLSAVFAGLIPVTLISSNGKGGEIAQEKSENMGNQGNVGLNPNVAAKNIDILNGNAVQIAPELNIPILSKSNAKFGDIKQDFEGHSSTGDSSAGCCGGDEYENYDYDGDRLKHHGYENGERKHHGYDGEHKHHGCGHYNGCNDWQE
ncbi:hypothetical protein K501DRAFT_273557 [Backusella circina FSU 941]|nr:hypothetical protein K501DRAFT_273557 [Backusella circina FSU 941]